MRSKASRERQHERAHQNRQSSSAKKLKYLRLPINKERTRLKARKRYAENEREINSIKLERGCADCGYRAHHVALHFDHLPGCKKVKGISQLKSSSWKVIETEIGKCEVVCANCHAIRTWNRDEQRRYRD